MNGILASMLLDSPAGANWLDESVDMARERKQQCIRDKNRPVDGSEREAPGGNTVTRNSVARVMRK